jgi:hypothetical protein
MKGVWILRLEGYTIMRISHGSLYQFHLLQLVAMGFGLEETFNWQNHADS